MNSNQLIKPNRKDPDERQIYEEFDENDIQAIAKEAALELKV